jgi:dihydrofolate reductase
MKNISIIVAIAENNAIGKDNQLLWHLSDDLKRFKEITSGHQVVMGRNTYLSLPFRPLKNRENIVITDDRSETFEGCTTVYSIEEAMAKCHSEKESFVIGGGSVYRQFLPVANKLYITRVHRDFDADTFFPEIDENNWKLVNSEHHPADEKHEMPFTFLTYVKYSD